MAKKEKKEGEVEKVLTVEEKIEALQKIVENQNSTIAMLTEVADRGRVDNFNKNNKKAIETIVNVSTLNGLVVVAWRSILDEVYKDSLGVWHEKQVVEVTTEDEKTQTMDYVDFSRNIKKVPATVVMRGKTKISDEPEIYSEEFRVSVEGKEYTLDGAFIN